jgi:hypothetical protein
MVSQKKNSQVSNSPVAEVSTPVVEAVTPVAVASEKKGGAKGKKVVAAAEPVAVEPVAVEPVAAAPQKGGAKGKKAAAPVVAAEPVVAAPKKGGKKVAAAPVVEGGAKAKKAAPKPKMAKKVAATPKPKATKKVEGEADVEGEELEDGKTRSFKVQLPEEEEFSGRFTGLTPYQAANKALSKFFRNSDNTNISEDHILFSIKESTRGSKRHTYTYKGTRVKLAEPITYTIKSATGEDRVITKQYKNQLIKVKKGVASKTVQVASANA